MIGDWLLFLSLFPVYFFMQNTRLNNLLETIYRSLSEWFLNPWRRLSLLLISFLFGFFLGSAVSTTAGQKAELDIVVAGFLVLLTEITSRIFYSRSFFARQVFWVATLNYLKVGFIYSLFLEALKLGS
ncbi:hypothetical protein NIES806_46590 [Dolichospermum compactum NIES-806]|uniref:DUF565 domain-containing protein n=2 Tax=Dolichospermum compactum TaxID=136073 RepID=A0A1Z4VA20_9CYAN|nr:hypothetical protein NIES806_46590 [Dolichospermum compactum NIES-806]